MTTGRAARVQAADSRAQYSPSPVMNPTSDTAVVFAWTAVSFTAKKNSYHAKITQMSAVAAIPGETMGKITSRTEVHVLAPSIPAASISSPGTSRKNERIIQTAIGRFIAV